MKTPLGTEVFLGSGHIVLDGVTVARVRGTAALVLYVYEISREPLNGFGPNSHGTHVWFLARTSLKVKDQGHQGQKWHFGPFRRPACGLFGKINIFSL